MENGPRLSPASSPAVLVTSLLAVGALLACLGAFAGVTTLAWLASRHALTLWSCLAAAGWAVGGAAGGSVLWALSWLIQRLSRADAEGRLGPYVFKKPGPIAPLMEPASLPRAEVLDDTEAPPLQAELLRRMLAELEELNTNLLLSPDERQAKGRKLRTERAAALIKQVQQAIKRGDFASADASLEALSAEAPDDARIGDLRRQVEQGRADAKAADVREATRRAEDLMAIGDFPRSLGAARELAQRYPDSPEAAELLARVEREERAFSSEQRSRLYARIEKSVQQHNWSAAVEAAVKLMETYPDSSEAELVGAQMQTLRTNARIEEVRAFRDRIRDLIERRRYFEAIDLAQEVIRDYPETAAAQDLRRQLPKLQERAKDSGDES